MNLLSGLYKLPYLPICWPSARHILRGNLLTYSCAAVRKLFIAEPYFAPIKLGIDTAHREMRIIPAADRCQEQENGPGMNALGRFTVP